MIRKTKNGVPFYEFELFQNFRGGLRHAIFTRGFDIDNSSGIQKIFDAPASSLPISFKTQLHGTNIWMIEKNQPEDFSEVERNGDILITDMCETPLMIRIADCASIMLFDPVEKVIANIHAGWRGIAKRVIHKTIDRLKIKFDCRPENLLSGVSPMIGPCCCRFSDPYRELPKAMHSYIIKGNMVAPFGMVNLWSAVEEHLKECGIKEKHIENPRICTACHPEDFFSYRRERSYLGKMGRFATAIMLQ